MPTTVQYGKRAVIDFGFIDHPLAGTPIGAALDLCIALTLIIVPSIRVTESISAAKYPGYRAYQAKTPVLIPFLRFARPARGA